VRYAAGIPAIPAARSSSPNDNTFPRLPSWKTSFCETSARPPPSQSTRSPARTRRQISRTHLEMRIRRKVDHGERNVSTQASGRALHASALPLAPRRAAPRPRAPVLRSSRVGPGSSWSSSLTLYRPTKPSCLITCTAPWGTAPPPPARVISPAICSRILTISSGFVTNYTELAIWLHTSFHRNGNSHSPPDNHRPIHPQESPTAG
jgi:hypothetical protein